jgi:hypothetical protein
MRAKRESAIGQIKPVHPYAWLWEPLEAEASFVIRAMFGAKAAYLDGKLMLCFTAKAEPWRGVLVCTDRSHHASLLAEFPMLSPHPVLPKWLYLRESLDAFESVATRLVRLARQRDPRIGVAPKPRKRGPRITRINADYRSPGRMS